MATESRSNHGSKLYRTTNLVMAAYLIAEGYDPELVEMDGEQVKEGQPQGAWEFELTPALQGLVDGFAKDTAAVEPQAFYTTLKQARREMFAHLKIGS